MNYFSKGIDAFDMFGKRPKMFINGQQSYKSNYSLLLSFFHHVITLLLTIKVICTLINTKSARMTYSKEHFSFPPLYNLNSLTFPFAFTLVNKEYRVFIDEEIYYPLAYLSNRYYNQQEMKYEIEEYPIELSRCTKSDFENHLVSGIDEKNLNQYYCLKNLNVTVFGNQVSSSESSIMIYLKECKKIAPVDFDQICKDQNIINEKLNEAYFAFLYTGYNINLTNFSEPKHTYLSIDYARISNFVNKEMLILYKQVSIVTDNNLFFYNEDNNDWIQYDHIRELLSLKKRSDMILSVKITLSNLIEKYSRIRIKGAFILSIIGGILNFTNLIFYFLSLLFTSSSMNLKLMNSFFSFEFEGNNNAKQTNKSLNSLFNDSLQCLGNCIKKESPSLSLIHIQNLRQRNFNHHNTHQTFKKRLNHTRLSLPIFAIELFKIIPCIMKKNHKKYDMFTKGQEYIQKRLDYVYLLNHFAYAKKAFNYLYDQDQQTLIGMKTFNNKIASFNNDNDYDKNYNKIYDCKNKTNYVIGENITKAFINISQRIQQSNNDTNAIDKKILAQLYPIIII